MELSSIIEGSVTGAVAIVLGIIGYFKMIIPISERLARLESDDKLFREWNDERWKSISFQLDQIDKKLDIMNQRTEAVTITLFGVDGKNGFRGRIFDLEKQVDSLLNRLTIMETISDGN